MRDDLFFSFSENRLLPVALVAGCVSMQQLHSSSSWSLSKKVLCHVYYLLLIMDNKCIEMSMCYCISFSRYMFYICLVLNVLYYTMCNMYYVLNTHT